MYGRFSGVRHVAWRVVNETSLVSVAVYSFTGMFTRPNEMLPLQIARAAGMEIPALGLQRDYGIRDLALATDGFSSEATVCNQRM
jgi:hypothetical protein